MSSATAREDIKKMIFKKLCYTPLEMATPEFFLGGVPRRMIDTDPDSLKYLGPRFGAYEVATLEQVIEIDPDAPKEMVTVADNWWQLVSIKQDPAAWNSASAGERQKSSGLISVILPWDAERDTIGIILADIAESVKNKYLDPRSLRKLALLDLATNTHPVNEAELLLPFDTPWGTAGILKGTGLLVYVINCGYSRKKIVDLEGMVNGKPRVSIVDEGLLVDEDAGKLPKMD